MFRTLRLTRLFLSSILLLAFGVAQAEGLSCGEEHWRDLVAGSHAKMVSPATDAPHSAKNQCCPCVHSFSFTQLASSEQIAQVAQTVDYHFSPLPQSDLSTPPLHPPPIA